MGALHKMPGRFAEATVDGEIVLMDIDSGNFLLLRESATAIWEMIDGKTDRDMLLERLQAMFDGSPATIARDLDSFLDQLREARFVA